MEIYSQQSLRLLNAFGDDDIFTFEPSEDAENRWCCSMPQPIQIRDGEGEPVMSIVIMRQYNNGNLTPFSIYHFMGPSGIILFSVRASIAVGICGNSILEGTVSTGGIILGYVGLLRSTISACSRKVNGQLLLEGSVGKRSGCLCDINEFNIYTPEGILLGTVESLELKKSQRSVVLTLTDETLEPRTKAIILWIAYVVYWTLFYKTRYSTHGIKGSRKRVQLVLGCVGLTYLIIFIVCLSTWPEEFKTKIR